MTNRLQGTNHLRTIQRHPPARLTPPWRRRLVQQPQSVLPVVAGHLAELSENLPLQAARTRLVPGQYHPQILPTSFVSHDVTPLLMGYILNVSTYRSPVRSYMA